MIRLGTYVLATKYSDGENYDYWYIGHYAGKEGDHHYVTDEHGNQISPNGFRRCEPITNGEGRYLLENIPDDDGISATVNIWEMLETYRDENVRHGEDGTRNHESLHERD